MIESFASGRICLFGDHQDYLGLPVITTEIDKGIHIRGQAVDTDYLHIELPDIGRTEKIRFSDSIGLSGPRDYLRSCLKVVSAIGCRSEQGFQIEISGDLPMNSGLSSSTALCIAWIRFLLTAAERVDLLKDKKLIVNLAYKAEVVEFNEPGGIMDQMAISFGGTRFIQTAEPCQAIPIAHSLPGLIVADSGESKKTLDVLTKARERAERGLQQLSTFCSDKELKALSIEDLDKHRNKISSMLTPYIEAALLNHKITLDAYNELKSSDPDHQKLGRLMTAHQDILRDKLKVSTLGLDGLIAVALSAGALGAKLIGSGGGGCIVAFAPGHEEDVIEALENAGAREVFRANSE